MKRSVLSRVILLFGIGILLSGCVKVVVKPEHGHPDASPMYDAGWKEGCDSGLAVGDGKDGYRKSPTYQTSNEFRQAWEDGYWYCRLFAERFL